MCKSLRTVWHQRLVAVSFQTACFLPCLSTEREPLGSWMTYICLEVCCTRTCGFPQACLLFPVLSWNLTSVESLATLWHWVFLARPWVTLDHNAFVLRDRIIVAKGVSSDAKKSWVSWLCCLPCSNLGRPPHIPESPYLAGKGGDV